MRNEYNIRIEWKDPETNSTAAITEQTAKGRSPVEAHSVIRKRKTSKELISEGFIPYPYTYKLVKEGE